MSKYLKLATLSVAVVAGLLVAHFAGYLPMQMAEPTTDTAQVAPETPALASTTQPQSSGGQTAPQEAVFDPEKVDPTSIDWAAMRARYTIGKSRDPMLIPYFPFEGFTDREIAAFNKLAVLPFNPKVGEECTTTVFLAGEPGEFVSDNCVPVFERPKHPYEQLPLDQLIDLAETDAEAAVFVSRKIRDTDETIRFAVRASALSAKPGPIMAITNGRIRARGVGSTPEETTRNANELVNRIVLERIAAVLGDPRANPQAQEKYLSDFTQTPEQVQQFLDLITEKTQKVLDEMIEIERETTGSTAVWEKVNA